MNDQVADAKASYARCKGKDFLDKFYGIFLKSSPEIGPMFAKTDFAVQKDLLLHGINLVIMFAEGKIVGQNGIDRIRQSHCHTKLNIAPRLYPFWKNSFLQAVKESDPQFTAATQKSWELVLQKSIDYIAAGY